MCLNSNIHTCLVSDKTNMNNFHPLEVVGHTTSSGTKMSFIPTPKIITLYPLFHNRFYSFYGHLNHITCIGKETCVSPVIFGNV